MVVDPRRDSGCDEYVDRPGKLRVGETAAVGQQVHREPGRNLLAVLEKTDELIRVQRRLAAGKTESPRPLRQQADHFPDRICMSPPLSVTIRLTAGEQPGSFGRKNFHCPLEARWSWQDGRSAAGSTGRR